MKLCSSRKFGCCDKGSLHTFGTHYSVFSVLVSVFFPWGKLIEKQCNSIAIMVWICFNVPPSKWRIVNKLWSQKHDITGFSIIEVYSRLKMWCAQCAWGQHSPEVHHQMPSSAGYYQQTSHPTTSYQWGQQQYSSSNSPRQWLYPTSTQTLNNTSSCAWVGYNLSVASGNTGQKMEVQACFI